MRPRLADAIGTIFRLPNYLSPNLPETLTRLRDAGITCMAAHPHTDRKYLYNANLRRDVCVVLGSEGEGIRPATLAACDEVVAVPMLNGVDSLNVGNAAAVFFYEALRQRTAAPRD